MLRKDPKASIATLRGQVVGLPRNTVTAYVRRWRRVRERRNRRRRQRTTWLVPGAVWAIDFAEPPQPIDGLYPYLLAVRDLASGRQLLWLPLVAANAATAAEALGTAVPGQIETVAAHQTAIAQRRVGKEQVAAQHQIELPVVKRQLR